MGRFTVEFRDACLSPPSRFPVWSTEGHGPGVNRVESELEAQARIRTLRLIDRITGCRHEYRIVWAPE